MAMPIPPELPQGMITSTTDLPYKRGGPISYSYLSPTAPSSYPFNNTNKFRPTLLVFVNGLGLPQTGWYPTIQHLYTQLSSSGKPYPAIFTYDRFGQGKSTARDPLDSQPGNEKGYGHDMADAARNLHDLIEYFSGVAFPDGVEDGDQDIILVGNSIGCPIIRLLVAQAPGIAQGIIFLDSNMANNDMVDGVFPDPDSQSFDKATALPDGVSIDDLIQARRASAAVFHPSVVNPEGLDRRNAAQLLPYAHQPRLQGRVRDWEKGEEKEPLLYVVGHDPEEFARQTKMSPRMGMKAALTDRYVNKVWRDYNEGLVKLIGRSRGVIIAKNCGHFVQRDGPQFVAGLVVEMLEEVKREF